MTAKELHEIRNKTVAEMRKLSDLLDEEKRDFTSEEQEQWDKHNEEINDLEKRIQREKDLEDIEARHAERTDERGREEHDAKRRGDRTVTEQTRALAMQGWCLRQMDQEISEEQREACELTGQNPERREFDVRLPYDHAPVKRAWQAEREHRALSTSATAGGETIPEGFMREFELSLLAFGGMRQVSRIVRTATGNDLPWPTSNDTGNSGAILAENAAVTEQDIVTAAITFNAFKYTSKLVRVSIELLQDTAFNLVTVLGRMLGERIGRITNTHFTTGDASSKPNGIVTAAGVGVTAASGTAITSDELIDLFHSVDPAYRGPGSGWMMADGVAKLIRKLKDGNSQYLWQPGLTIGMPDVMLGAPVTINQDMDQVPAVNDLVVIFGQLNKYIIRDVANMRLRRLVERYADNDQEGFVAFSRHDGDLLDAGTDPVKSLKMAAV